MEEKDIKPAVRMVLKKVAPEEIALLNSFDPALDSSGTTTQGPLGFGVSESITLVLPVVYLFFSELVKAAGKKTGEELQDAIATWIFDRENHGAQVPRDKIRSMLEEYGLDPERIDATTDAIVQVLKDERYIG